MVGGRWSVVGGLRCMKIKSGNACFWGEWLGTFTKVMIHEGR